MDRPRSRSAAKHASMARSRRGSACPASEPVEYAGGRHAHLHGSEMVGPHLMKRTWTIIGVSDVPRSFKWYQSLFGQPVTSPGHPDFGQLLDSDGTVLLCLHQWGIEDHPSLKSPRDGTPGNGLLLFFRIDDYDMALRRARALVAHLEEEPHVNPNT